MVLLLLIAALVAGVIGFALRRLGYSLEGEWVNGGGLVLLFLAVLGFLSRSGPPRDHLPRDPTDFPPPIDWT